MKANYLASPPLVVAYALAGTTDIDLTTEPLGTDRDGKPVMLAEIWPSQKEVAEAEARINADMFARDLRQRLRRQPDLERDQGARGRPLRVRGRLHLHPGPALLLRASPRSPRPSRDIEGARLLAVLGDSVTTDHISPAGDIAEKSPAGRFLIASGAAKKDFNSYGSRRGNDRVMVRGTFANIRLKNLMVPGVEGGVTVHQPSGERLDIFDAAMRYQKEGVPLVVLAGKEYGTRQLARLGGQGHAAPGRAAVIAESFERIHRSNLVGMGVLPLVFKPGPERRVAGPHAARSACPSRAWRASSGRGRT